MASQSASNRDWPNEEAEAQGLLTTVLPEILLKIIAQLPLRYFLDLVQTCRVLRNFIKINASRICNQKIRSQFAFEAKILQSELDSGWLIPKNPFIEAQETHFYNGFYPRVVNFFPKMHRRVLRRFHILGEIQGRGSASDVSLTIPGPQFLFFLEQGLLDIDLHPDEGRLPSLKAPRDRFCDFVKVVIDGKRYLLGFNPRQGSIGVCHFEDFLRRFHMNLAVVKRGHLVPHTYWRDKFPRELIWFFGVERLRIMEEGEAEDWKKLPMLLWE